MSSSPPFLLILFSGGALDSLSRNQFPLHTLVLSVSPSSRSLRAQLLRTVSGCPLCACFCSPTRLSSRKARLGVVHSTSPPFAEGWRAAPTGSQSCSLPRGLLCSRSVLFPLTVCALWFPKTSSKSCETHSGDGWGWLFLLLLSPRGYPVDVPGFVELIWLTKGGG